MFDVKLFHQQNPCVYAEFVRRAFEEINYGETRLSARHIFHAMRKERGKLNDHLSPYYVRLFAADYPEHAGKFEMRGAIADRLVDERQDNLFEVFA